MAVNVKNAIYANPVMEKNVIFLRKYAEQTKLAVVDKLKKSEQRFNEEIKTLEEGEIKTLLLKKLEKISKELKILENLSADDIVRFALFTKQNLMVIASNRRTSLIMRMKARVASHKPLSAHLAKIKSKLQKAKEEESEDESEEEEEPEMSSSQPFDKMFVNNQIVKMRKYVKKAKVFIIHKLTRNINKLRKCKGKNEEKSKKKADKMVKKIQYLKKLKEDDISRFALTSTEDLIKLSTDINTTMKVQVMATVAVHKCVYGIIVDFKGTYPDCIQSIPKILTKKKKKRKLINETGKSDKENIKVSNKNSRASKLNSDAEQSESEKEGNESGDGSESESEKEGNESGDGSELSEEEREQSDFNLKNENDNEQSSESEADPGKRSRISLSSVENSDLDDHHVESESDIHTSKKIKNKKSCNLNEPLFKNSSDNKDRKKTNSRKNAKSPKETKTNKSEPQKVVDPFFVTSTNEEYVTSQVPSLVQDNHSNQRARYGDIESRELNKFNNNNRKRGAYEKYNKHNKFSKFDSQPYKKPTFNRFDKGPEYNKFNTTTKLVIGNRKERRKALNQSVQEEKVEKLHPSWEAKKKLSNIANFQGKKITFD